jgi:hypothetical protein
MTKRIQIRLTDSEGKMYSWIIRTAVKGWEFTDHEGYTRYNEGNWNSLVFRFKRVAANYGLALASELS